MRETKRMKKRERERERKHKWMINRSECIFHTHIFSEISLFSKEVFTNMESMLWG